MNCSFCGISFVLIVLGSFTLGMIATLFIASNAMTEREFFSAKLNELIEQIHVARSENEKLKGIRNGDL